MKILLDTHTALWWVNEYEKLSPEARKILLNDKNTLYISIISVWEIAIKVSIGKLQEFNGGVRLFLSEIENMPVNIIHILPSHVEKVEMLPFVHRDPFDRLLVAVANVEGMTILTADENIHKYDAKSVW